MMKKFLFLILLILCSAQSYSQRNIFGLTLGSEFKISDAESILRKNGLNAYTLNWDEARNVHEINLDQFIRAYDVEFGGYSWFSVLFMFREGFFMKAKFYSSPYKPERFNTLRDVLKEKHPNAYNPEEIMNKELGYREFSLFLPNSSTVITVFGNFLGKKLRTSDCPCVDLEYRYDGELKINPNHYNDL